MKKSIILTVAGLMLLAAAPLACNRGSEESETLAELRTYSVPHGYENEIRSMLRTTLGTDETSIGRAAIGPGGKLVVVAPTAVHRGIQQFVKELDSIENAPPPTPVALSYWMIAGRPSSGTTPYQVMGKQPLDDVQQALEQIVLSQGPTDFTLIERLKLVSIGEDTARISGRIVGVSQQASVAAQGDVIARIRIGMRRYSLETEVKLEPGQFVVLGNTGYDGGFDGQQTDERELMLYFVITSELPS